VNIEPNDPWSLQKVGETLRNIGDRLVNEGSFEANGAQIRPSSECFFKFRYELSPRGELIVKCEFAWTDDSDSVAEAEGDELTIS
jgi:hypothetical protein